MRQSALLVGPLRGTTLMWTFAEFGLSPPHFGNRRRVVLIDPDEVVVVPVGQQPRIRRHHRIDDVMLVPGRHHDRQRPLGQAPGFRNRRRQRLVLLVLTAEQLQAPVVQIDENIVDAGNRGDAGQRDQQHFDVEAIV